ncbi:hypothetical protein ADUPG1_011261 [Aduncisulcus paluster]|uniref:Uncharacterized protein n=1 Tax=Aduncisulcus paluster TaxID=2918883 RepID=A0ABQ5JZZ8_9EUKA|nr:hypothetical protein ADUPG1_011261 [Aduncisulcus paluster]
MGCVVDSAAMKEAAMRNGDVMVAAQYSSVPGGISSSPSIIPPFPAASPAAAPLPLPAPKVLGDLKERCMELIVSHDLTRKLFAQIIEHRDSIVKGAEDCVDGSDASSTPNASSNSNPSLSSSLPSRSPLLSLPKSILSRPTGLSPFLVSLSDGIRHMFLTHDAMGCLLSKITTHIMDDPILRADKRVKKHGLRKIAIALYARCMLSQLPLIVTDCEIQLVTRSDYGINASSDSCPLVWALLATRLEPHPDVWIFLGKALDDPERLLNVLKDPERVFIEVDLTAANQPSSPTPQPSKPTGSKGSEKRSKQKGNSHTTTETSTKEKKRNNNAGKSSTTPFKPPPQTSTFPASPTISPVSHTAIISPKYVPPPGVPFHHTPSIHQQSAQYHQRGFEAPRPEFQIPSHLATERSAIPFSSHPTPGTNPSYTPSSEYYPFTQPRVQPQPSWHGSSPRIEQRGITRERRTQSFPSVPGMSGEQRMFGESAPFGFRGREESLLPPPPVPSSSLFEYHPWEAAVQNPQRSAYIPPQQHMVGAIDHPASHGMEQLPPDVPRSSGTSQPHRIPQTGSSQPPPPGSQSGGMDVFMGGGLYGSWFE